MLPKAAPAVCMVQYKYVHDGVACVGRFPKLSFLLYMRSLQLKSRESGYSCLAETIHASYAI